ncbi:MAG: hypothetical protein K8R59_01410 [Thermoanaerobaculales bacterium]|nr:hypothetical protein [Thermoanaerobaculales bacterium]
MRKLFVLGILVLAVAVIAGAANMHRQTVENTIVLKAPPEGRAPQTIDYLAAPGWTYGDGFYFGNLFHPDGGWYPVQVQSFDVVMQNVDGTATTTGVLDRVVLVNPAGSVLASAANVPGVAAGTWANIPLATPQTIASGDFIGFVWQPDSNERLYGGTATNWNTSVSREPHRAGGGTAAAAAITVTSAIGSGYATVSAAAIRANVDTNVPVELMAFSVE